MIQLVTFRELNDKLTADNNLFGAIIFSDKDWQKKEEGEYSLAERTYIFSGDNKAFGNYAGYSCFASDVAGIDRCIRLEQYWGKWEKIACFVLNEEGVDEFKSMIEKGIIA